MKDWTISSEVKSQIAANIAEPICEICETDEQKLRCVRLFVELMIANKKA